MGYRVEIGGPGRPALISLRIDEGGVPAVERALGVSLPRAAAGLVTASGAVTAFGLGVDEWLIRVEPEEEGAWLGTLEEAVAGSFGAVVIVSDAYRVFTIAGPDSLDVLAQATGIDVHPSAFPTGRAARAGFAAIAALIHRLDDRPAFDIYVDSSLVRYAGRWIEAATGGGASARPG